MENMMPYEGNDKYAFISYCHKDKDKVYPVIDELMGAGYRIWYDTGINPGMDWPEVIAEHLGNAGACIAFVTESSLKSHNCRKEVNFAVVKQIPLLIVMLEDAELTLALQMQLATHQAVLAYENDVSLVDELLKFDALNDCKGIPVVKAAKVVKKECHYLIHKATKAPVMAEGTVVIGRAEDCDYPVAGNETVSSHHAELFYDNGKVYITDKGSTNGTFIKGQKIEKNVRIELKYKEEIRLGTELFEVDKAEVEDIWITLECLRSGKVLKQENDSEIYMGSQSEVCGFSITDNPLISKKHLKVKVCDGSVYVCDESTNGTWFGGRRLPKNTGVEIKESGLLRLANELVYMSIFRKEEP